MFIKRLTYYCGAGLIAGLLLMSIEAIDRLRLLSPFFHSGSERISFLIALIIVPTSTLLFTAMMAALTNLSDRLIDRYFDLAKTKQYLLSLPVKALVISLPFILIAKLIPELLTYGFIEIIDGINKRSLNSSLLMSAAPILLYLTIYLVALFFTLINSDRWADLIGKRWLAIPATALFFIVTLACYWVDSRIFVGRYFFSFHVPLTLVASASSLLIGLILAQRFRDQRLWIGAISLLIIAMANVEIFYFDSNQAAKSLFWHRGVTARKYLGLIQHLTDFDQDRFSSFMGGGDCDNFDETISPLSKENPTTSIDENCFDSLPTTPTKNFAELNQQPLTATSVKNVLFITIDCLRADHLGTYGYQRKLSPNIDKFAAKSLVFENAFSLGTNTGHSFTGIARANNGEKIFDHDIPTIARAFLNNGYTTAAITSPRTDDWLNKQDWENYRYVMLQGVEILVHSQERYWNSKKLTDQTIEFINTQQDKPFYIWVHYNDLHAKNEKYKRLGKHDFGTAPIDLYDANIAFTDDHLGRLLDYLESSKLLENTIVAISADHGEEFLDHGQQFHNGRLYREQTHVPLILYYPGQSAARITQPVSTIDLGPTFLRAAGFMPSKEYAGVDLMQTVAGLCNGRPILIETPRNVPQGDFFAWAIVNGDWRLIYDMAGHTFELYNDKTDPAEKHNLYDQEPVKAKEMKALLSEWFDRESHRQNYGLWSRF